MLLGSVHNTEKDNGVTTMPNINTNPRSKIPTLWHYS